MKWYKRFGTQIAIVSICALILGFALFVVFRSQDIFGTLSDAVSAAISTLGALSVGGIAVIQLRKHKIYEEQAELDRQVKEKQIDAMNLEREFKIKQFDAQQSDRLTRAIEHLKDQSLAVRMGALFELKKLGVALPNEQKNIIRILEAFIRRRIQTKSLLAEGFYKASLQAPKGDVFLACEITSLFWNHSKYFVSLEHLQAEQIDLTGIDFQGANLQHANFQEAGLGGANFQGANLWHANFQGAFIVDADFRGADLRFVRNLTAAEQLLYAKIDEYTLLKPTLRAELDAALRAEQNQTPTN